MSDLKNLPGYEFLRDCEWEEVFLSWYKNEGERPGWIKLAQERGYASWADWRLKEFASRFRCRDCAWSLYEISDSSENVARWFGGPFKSWMEKYYDGLKTKTFAELVDHPGIQGHTGIQSMCVDYPKNTVITAMEMPDGRITVIEGMHRSCALALSLRQGKPYQGKLVFAIGKSVLTELPASGRGTQQV